MANKLKKKPPTRTKRSTGSPKIDHDGYRLFVEDIADGFFKTSLRGDFIFFNDSFCNKFFGYSRKEMKSRNYRNFMDKKNADIAFQSFNQLYKRGQGIANCIWSVKDRSGDIHILEVTVELTYDENKVISGFRGIAQDVTEKHLALQKAVEAEKKAQEKYKQSQLTAKLLESLLQFLPDPVLAFNLDNTVEYINPAFEKVFGWTVQEIKQKEIDFIPEYLKDQARKGIKQLNRDKSIHNFKTKRMTKDGRVLDIIVDGAIFYDEKNKPAGQVLTLRDFTRQNRISRTNQILFKISESLQQYQRLDDLLTSINKEIKKLMAIKGAFVLLLDDNKEEFFFFSALLDGTESEKKFKKIRFAADQGVSGQVYKTGKPLIVHDVSKCSFFLRRVDEETDLDAKNILTVPIHLKDNIIGVLAVVNKVSGPFDDNDIELLSAIASTIALPIENARINEKLRKSYDDLQSINKAKDRVIHHLSHELKTPVSVLAASFKLLSKELEKLGIKTGTIDRILERGKRNLKRLLEIQYEVEDLLKQKKYQAYHILSKMLEVLKDELEILFESELEQKNLVPVIRSKIDELFGHKEFESVQIRLDHFLKEKLASLAPLFRHRQCHIETEINQPVTVNLPREILHFVTEGIIRNAIENTPDLGKIKIKVRPTKKKAELIFTDFGVGITREKKRLLFENYFNAPDTLLYSTKKPYDFNAGGKGFDLLRFKIFSERYLFKIEIKSKRCHFIPADEDICPGNIDQCSHCLDLSNCHKSGGTTIRLIFPIMQG